MTKGRKKLPTKIKEMQGTLEASREVINEMQVDLVQKIPEPPELLSEIGKKEWYKVTNQLYNLNMLHNIDLRLIEAYCNEISLYIETEMMLREKGRIQVFKNSDLLHSGQPGTKFPRICIEVTIMRALHDGSQADEPHPLGRHFLNVGSAYSDECKAKQSATGLSDRLAVQKATCFTCGIS